MIDEKEQKLKLALVKMLPEKVKLFVETIIWKRGAVPIKETEWLHVCWLIEEELKEINYDDYRLYSFQLFQWHGVSPTWQQRATDLCRIKGIEI